MVAVVGFMDILSAQAEAIGDRRNGPHTKLRIQIATAQLLEELGYNKLSIGVICEKVNLTRPGFYLHYRNKQEVVMVMLDKLVATEAQLLPTLTECDDLAHAVHEICSWYMNFHMSTEALFATLTELRRSVPSAFELQAKRSRTLHKAISYQLNRFAQYRDIDPEWTAFALDETARAMNTTANRLNARSGPASMQYANDIDRLISMFARMMYQSFLGMPMPGVGQADANTDDLNPSPDLVAAHA